MKTIRRIFAAIGFTVFSFALFMVVTMTLLLILMTQLIVRI